MSMSKLVRWVQADPSKRQIEISAKYITLLMLSDQDGSWVEFDHERITLHTMNVAVAQLAQRVEEYENA